MNKLLTFLVLTLLPAAAFYAQTDDSVKTYHLREVSVFGKKYHIDQSEFPVEKDNLNHVLELGGFSIIRKGAFLAQDVYADGLKRGDYTIVIDGERYHNACPNRMDSPLSRINPIEVEAINMVKSSSNLQSGLGGVIEVKRAVPSDAFRFSGSLSQMLGKSNETGIALLAEQSHQRLSLRYVRGLPYKTSENRAFNDLYGYKDNTMVQFSEGSFYGAAGSFKYSASFMYSENVSFPYLQMDEIRSAVYNLSASYGNYKLYFNYTDHLMNNTLRKSTMFMETDAKNLTVGFVSEFAEAYYRHLNADNNMRMLNGTMPISNHLLPDINLYSANVFHAIDFQGFKLSGKAGVSYYHMGDKDAINFYSKIHPGAKENRVFPLLGVSVSRTEALSGLLSLSGMLDLAAEAPEAEALFVSVKRMMGKPYWSGNPNLDQPIRASIRTNLTIPYVSLDMFGSYVFNYVYLASAKAGMQKYQTFGNVDALLLGATLRVKYEFLESEISYTYGENRTNEKPLLEVLPLHISNSITLPRIYGVKFFIRHTYESAQQRVDPTFSEAASGAWNRIDVGMSYTHSGITFGVDVENLLNHNYSKHLSYVRDPFASGMRVIEPGISYRFNIRYNY